MNTSQHSFLKMAALAAGLSSVSANAEIKNDLPRVEHPRPMMERAEWMTLNGPWEFAETDDNLDESFLVAGTYPDTITVPFCRESRLSGLARRGFVRNVWYRRKFDIPDKWNARRIRLHVGACDWSTRVWVNGHFVGRHVGGNTPFVFELTDVVRRGGNVVVIHAHDDTAGGKQPLGKQSRKEDSYGIFYTRTTGIWQSVWLEGVGESYIARHEVTPDPEHSRILLRIAVDGPSHGLTLNAEAFAGQTQVGQVSVPVSWQGNHAVLDLSQKRLWSPEDPFLYDLKLVLTRDGEKVDEVRSYFGLRRVSIDGRAILINGKPIFQRLVLDQGFYPDGVWTAPTDGDLRRDIEMSQTLGLNGARLHQKVFEPRFLYWADRLGYLVWGEYPSFGADYANAEVNLPIIDEWRQILERDFNHPSIVGWCPFNETPKDAAPLQRTILEMTRALDPNRPVLETSGWYHSMAWPDVYDAHDYNQDPVSFRSRWMGRLGDVQLPARYTDPQREVPFFVSEFGGIGWDVHGGWGYGQTPKTLDEFYARHAGLTNALVDNRLCFGFCYTQLTDVEQEKNGLYTFDRKPKFDADRIRTVNAGPARYEQTPPTQDEAVSVSWRVALASGPDGEQGVDWRYTVERPADEWYRPAFDDHAWQVGRGAFGRPDKARPFIRTEWVGEHIWLRNRFAYDGAAFDRATLVMLYDDAVEVYLNGETLWKGLRPSEGYVGLDVTGMVRKTLRKGDNTLAIHCRQKKDVQYVDAGLLLGTCSR